MCSMQSAQSSASEQDIMRECAAKLRYSVMSSSSLANSIKYLATHSLRFSPALSSRTKRRKIGDGWSDFGGVHYGDRTFVRRRIFVARRSSGYTVYYHDAECISIFVKVRER